MKITIRVERRDKHAMGVEGTLQAFVVDGGTKGADLLSGRQVSKVSTAIEAASAKIHKKYGNKVDVKWDLPRE